MKGFFLRLLRRQRVFLVMVAVILSISTITLGSHIFPDVVTTAFYHNAVEWVFNRGITAGCGGGLYCPDATVTRGQMAVFLQREGQALTPDGRLAFFGGGTPITSATTLVCITNGPPGSTNPPFTPNFPRLAALWTNLSIKAPAASTVTFGVTGAFSTDNGVTWTDVVGSSLTTTATNGTWSSVSNLGVILSLLFTNPPTTYLFAARISWLGPGVSADDYKCSMGVLILNNNPPTSPL